MNNDRKNRPSSSDFEVTPVRKSTPQREYTVEEISSRSNRSAQRSEALKNARKNNDIPAFEVSSVRQERPQRSYDTSLRQATTRTRQTDTSLRSDRTQARPRQNTQSEFEVSSFTQRQRTQMPERQSSSAKTVYERQATEEKSPFLREARAQRTPSSTRIRQTEQVRTRQASVQSEPAFSARTERARATENARQERVRATESSRQERVRSTEQKQRAQIEARRRELDSQLSHFTYKGKQPRNYAISVAITTFKILLIAVLITGISGIGFVIGMAKSYLESVPTLDFTLVSGQEQATVLYDVNGNSLGNYYELENREWASLDEIPTSLQNAVIAIEDVRFRRHMGIDFKRIIASLISNISSGSLQGGSTITQQLIKNTILSFEQTYKRKIQEASLALELEKQYTKNEILEAYLNTIYMGGSCYGMKTAAQDYFGKSLSELTLKECACLAGMIQNPSRYNPRSNFYSRSNPDRTINRTNLVLYEMYENGFITKEEYDIAKADTLNVNEKSPYSSSAQLIYFTDYVLESVVDELIEIRSLTDSSETRSSLRNEIRTSGYRIYSTIDSSKQKTAESTVYDFANYPRMRYTADSYTVAGRNPDGSVIRLTQPQTAVVVTDYRTGYIVAMVGGRQAPSGSLQFNRAYQSTMPVGSSIKPLSVYGPAIENGSGAGTVYYNTQHKIDGWNSTLGYPMNNNRTYPGWMTMRTAITASYNTTAATALMYDVGLDQAAETLEKLGVDPDHISKTGSGLALGSSGITPVEMAGAFSAIANMGLYLEPIAFTKVTDSSGNVIIDMLDRQEKTQVYSESTAWQLIDLLYTVVNEGAKRALVSGQTVYGKTGTNSDMRGVFFAGFTGYYTGTVWIGSDAYKPLVSDAQGGKYAAPLFSAVMTKLHAGLADRPATDVTAEEVGVMQVKYCSQSGKLATAACTKTHTELGNPSNLTPCDVHLTVKICSASGGLAKSSCPEESVTEQVITAVPEEGALNYMYNNYKSYFINHIGTPVTDISNCKVH